jgi:hypothetical protein
VGLTRHALDVLTAPTGGWKRQAAVIIGAVAVAGGIALAEGKPDPRGLKPGPVSLEARSLPGFDRETPQRTDFGRLQWRGGLVLTSPSSHFGGYSGLTIDSDGRRFAAVSDAGTWLTGEIVYSGNRVAGVRSTRQGALQSVDKKNLVRARDRDAEGLTFADGNFEKGTVLISFEGNDRIGRFGIDANGITAPAGYMSLPAEIKKVKSFDGLETVAVLRGGPMKGSVIAFAERLLPKDKHHAGWIWIGGQPRRLSLADIGGFDITDATGLPDGGLVVLERRFRWNEGVKMRLRLVKAGELKPDAVIAGEVLLEADLNQEIDNMEGLAAHAGANGEIVLTLISDDNFNEFLQRTVLLQFALPAHGLAAR